MLDPQVRRTESGSLFQMYSCDFAGCANTSPVPAGSNLLPRRWQAKEGKHYCNAVKCIHNRSQVSTDPAEQENTVVSFNKPVREIPKESTVDPFDPNRVFKYTCLRCGAGSDTGSDWSLVDGHTTFCNRAGCRNYAATHTNFRMLQMTERRVAFMQYFASFLVFVCLAGCVPVASAPTQSSQVPVTVSPSSVELEVDGTVQFTSSEGTATWSVEESGGGTITASGLYTAPATAGTYHVVSTTSDSRNGKSVVKVRKTQVTISPTTTQLTAGSSVQITASVSGPTDGSVTWSVEESGGGTITASGLYTAPATAGTYHTRATSVANSTKYARATITVGAPITIAVSPATVNVEACIGSQQFTASFTGTTDTRVQWSIQQTGCGTISSSGLYQPPASATGGSCTVVATSLADTTKIVTAAVTIAEKVKSVVPSPATVTLNPGQTQQFTATVNTSCGSGVSTAQMFTSPVTGKSMQLEITSLTYGSDTHKTSVLYEVEGGQKKLVARTVE